MREVKLTLCPEDILADLVKLAGLANEQFEAQLREESEGKEQPRKDCT